MKRPKQPNNQIPVVVTVFVTLFFINGNGQNLTPGVTTPTAIRIDSLMQLFQDYSHFNGAVLVSESGTITYAKAFGFANMEWKVPNTLETRFKLASLSKQFTALLILQLVEEGKIALNGKISDYLPDYPEKIGRQITIHHLLTHTSGIPNYHVIPDYNLNTGREYSRNEYLDLFKDKELLFEPGEQYQYTNLGYFILGCIAERVSGKKYDDLIEEKIFIPAGMSNSNTEEEKFVVSDMASGYRNVYIGYEPAKFRHPSQVFAEGHIVTTVEDFYKYDRALHEGKLISEELFELMHTPYKNEYGYGWNVSYYPKNGNDSVLLASHDGGTYGFSSSVYRFIGDNKLIIVLSNVAPYDCTNITRGIGRILYNREEIHPRKSIVEQFAITNHQFGLDSAIAEFYFLRTNNSDLFTLDGVEFNLLGYNYLDKGMIREAIAVFKLNVESFPDYGAPYDSLAEAYQRNGDTKLAIAYYEKALALDPNNSNARVMLKKLKKQNS